MAVIGKTASDTNLQYTDAGYLKQPARTVNPFLNRVLMRRKTDGFLERPPRNSARSCRPSMPTPLALFLVQDSHRAHLLGVLAAAPSECPVPLPEKRHTFCANEFESANQRLSEEPARRKPILQIGFECLIVDPYKDFKSEAQLR